jgi:hypothetical protein
MCRGFTSHPRESVLHHFHLSHEVLDTRLDAMEKRREGPPSPPPVDIRVGGWMRVFGMGSASGLRETCKGCVCSLRELLEHPPTTLMLLINYIYFLLNAIDKLYCMMRAGCPRYPAGCSTIGLNIRRLPFHLSCSKPVHIYQYVRLFLAFPSASNAHEKAVYEAD